MKKNERIKEIFIKHYNVDTDWSAAADAFINWCIDYDFENKSFAEFVDWIDDDELEKTWHFFFGYDTNYKKFAVDWVEKDEIKDYLKYCENMYM